MKRILPIVLALMLVFSGLTVAHAEGTLTISAHAAPAELAQAGSVQLTVEVSSGETPAENVQLFVNNEMVEELGNLSENQTKEVTVAVNITDDMFGKDIPVKATYTSQEAEFSTSTSFKVAKKELKVAVVAKASADNKKINAGDSVKFTFKVQNQGEVAITDASLTASPLNNGNSLTSSKFSLEPGSTKEFSYSVALSSNTTVTPVLTYTANGKPYTAKLEKINIEVNSADVELTLKAENTNITAGETANFTLTISNTGLVDIQNIRVLNPYGNPVAISSTTLAAGSSMDVTEAFQVNETGEFSYTVKASDKNGNELSVSSNAVNITVTPALASDALVLDIKYDLKELENGKLVFTITVTNNTDLTFTNIQISEKTLGSIGVIGTLAKGSTSINYEALQKEGVTEYVFSAVGKTPTSTDITASSTVRLPDNADESDEGMPVILIVLIIAGIIVLILAVLYVLYILRDRKNKEDSGYEEKPRKKAPKSKPTKIAAGAAVKTPKIIAPAKKGAIAPKGKGDRNNI